MLERIPPALCAAIGAGCIAFSAPLVALSETGAGTAAFYRCAIALPALALLVAVELRRLGSSESKNRVIAWVAGALLAGDLVFWNLAVSEVGAGISTVIVNLQVILVPLLALLIDRERLTRLFVAAVFPMLVGVAMAGGLGTSDVGTSPRLGTIHACLAAVCYAGYLFLLRRGTDGKRLALPLFDVTLAATVVSLMLGIFWQPIDFAPDWAAMGWLTTLALTSQVMGMLLIAASLPRLPSRTGAGILLLQPAGAVVLGFVLLNQTPSLVQLLGCVLVLMAVLLVSWEASARVTVGPAT